MPNNLPVTVLVSASVWTTATFIKNELPPTVTRAVAAGRSGGDLVLKYKVGVNLLYLKIGEMRSVCYTAVDQSSKGTVFVTRFRIKYGFGKWGRRDCVTAHGLRTDCQ